MILTKSTRTEFFQQFFSLVHRLIALEIGIDPHRNYSHSFVNLDDEFHESFLKMYTYLNLEGYNSAF